MNNNTNKSYCFIISSLFILCASLVLTSPAFGHGGKTHKETRFTTFQALQKAMTLYDKLIVSKKLPETWETNLVNVKISVRKKDEKSEYVVVFERSEEEPASVYFFFTMEGKYSGSNFTGK